MWICNGCNTQNSDKHEFCIECALPKTRPSENHCSNPACTHYDEILENPEQKYCGFCGTATIYWKKIEDMC